MKNKEKYLYTIDLLEIHEFEESYQTLKFNTEDEAKKIFEEYKAGMREYCENDRNYTQSVSLIIWEWNNVNGDYTDAVLEETYNVNNEEDRKKFSENYY